MNRHLTRLTTFILLPNLLVDPTLCHSSSGSGRATQRSELFTEQAVSQLLACFPWNPFNRGAWDRFVRWDQVFQVHVPDRVEQTLLITGASTQDAEAVKKKLENARLLVGALRTLKSNINSAWWSDGFTLNQIQVEQMQNFIGSLIPAVLEKPNLAEDLSDVLRKAEEAFLKNAAMVIAQAGRANLSSLEGGLSQVLRELTDGGRGNSVLNMDPTNEVSHLVKTFLTPEQASAFQTIVQRSFNRQITIDQFMRALQEAIHDQQSHPPAPSTAINPSVHSPTILRGASQALEKWKDAILVILHKEGSFLDIWVRVEMLMSLLVAPLFIASLDKVHFATRPLVIGPSESPDALELSDVGDFVRSSLAQLPGFTEAIGDVNPLLILLTDHLDDTRKFLETEHHIRQLIGQDPHARLLANFTMGVAVTRHLLGNGMHFLEHDRPIDNDLLVNIAREFIPLLLALPQDEWNANVPTMPGHEDVKIKFGDLMLWGLAHILDPRIHDHKIYLDFDVANSHKANKLWPEGAAQSISEYLLKMLTDLDEVDAQGQKTGRKIPADKVGKLLQMTFKSEEEWRNEFGFLPPGQDADRTPGAMTVHIHDILSNPNRPLRDAIFNLALASQGHRAEIMWWGSSESYWKTPWTVLQAYVNSYGHSPSVILERILREWEPFRNLGFLSTVVHHLPAAQPDHRDFPDLAA